MLNFDNSAQSDSFNDDKKGAERDKGRMKSPPMRGILKPCVLALLDDLRCICLSQAGFAKPQLRGKRRRPVWGSSRSRASSTRRPASNRSPGCPGRRERQQKERTGPPGDNHAPEPLQLDRSIPSGPSKEVKTAKREKGPPGGRTQNLLIRSQTPCHWANGPIVC